MDAILAQLSDPATYTALLSLAVMLIVLDIDNVVFMTIVALKLPQNDQKRALSSGLFIGLGLRVLMLFAIGYLTQLQTSLFSLDLGDMYHNDFTPRVLITLAGGLFLIYKATMEIHDKLEGPDVDVGAVEKPKSFWHVVMQITLLNIIFSLDSVITAVGMTNEKWLMVAGMAISMTIVFIFAHPISRFVKKHPTLKVLGLSFLLLIGVLLVTEALHVEIPKGYVYFAMAFSVLVEFMNIRLRKHGTPVQLHMPSLDDMQPGHDARQPATSSRAGADDLPK